MTDKVEQIKQALFDELLDQLNNGVKLENKEGDIVTVSVSAQVLTVAAKVVKDFQKDIPNADTVARKDAEVSESLRAYSERLKGVSTLTQ